MECPKCHFDNREGAKFCNECGHKFEVICPDCKASNRVGSKFCDECRYNLAEKQPRLPKELSFDEKIDKIQRYLPKGVTEKILSQRGRIEGERKQVTVMFCDMEGFTSMVERLGAEDAYNIMDQVYELLIHKVHDYDGTINEMTGDGIMALFGAPIALEDAPQRAIRSAYSIHREMTRFSDRLIHDKKGISSIKMRIGIHSGPVVVGTLGNDLRVEFKAVGDTVNLASRMEGLAEPGTTYVSSNTFKLTEGFFRFEALGDKRIKGKKTSVSVYRVISSSTRKTRFDVNAERGLTPFVGRNRELELLLDSLGRAKEGSGQAFSIIGEAGVGKSRFLYEFRKAISNEDIIFLEGKCLSYGRGNQYHPISDVLRGNFEIGENDTDEEIRNKVRKSLEVLNVNEVMTLPYLLELLAVKNSGIDSTLLSPEGLKDRTIEAIKQIILKGSQNHPLVLAIEDLHWADKATEDALKWLLEAVPGAKVLIIFTYRPEFIHTWGGRSYHNQITLNRLSNRESLFMVSNLLGTDTVDMELQSLILSKTEGVPFFVEEFVKSLLDLEIIKKEDDKYLFQGVPQSISIPSTIQDMIMARVDSLPNSAKEVLQAGSAIEREFSHALIEEVANLPEKALLSNLATLKDSELLYERGIYPQSAYIFKHALTREVIYDSILTKRKKMFHNEIGNAIETLHKEDIDEYYGVLAEHFIVSDNYEKGAEYSRRAGKQAVKKSSYGDAVSYAKKSISCLEMLPKTDAIQKSIIDNRTALSMYCQGLNYHFEGMQAVAPVVNLAKRINYVKRLPRIYVATGTYKIFIEEDIKKGIEDLTIAKTLSEKTGDFLSLWHACYFLGTAHWFQCDFEKSDSYNQMAFELSKTVNHATGICFSQGSTATQNYAFIGKIELAYKLIKDSLDIANETGDIYIQQMVFSCYGFCCLVKGLFKESETYFLKAIPLYGKIQHVVWGSWACFWIGELYFNIGKYDKAQYYYDQAYLLIEEHKGFPSWANLAKLKSISAKMMQHGMDIHVESLFEYEIKNKWRLYEGIIPNNIGFILMNSDSKYFPEAEQWINKAIEANERNGIRWYLAADYALYAELFTRSGDPLKAKRHLSKAIKIFKECGAVGWVEKYEKELAIL